MYMFESTKLQKANLSGWQSAPDSYYDGMFRLCASLNEVDISSFAFTSNTRTRSMFNGCGALTTIYCDKNLEYVLTTDNSSQMFGSCSALPHFIYNKTDKTYAYPDNGQSGYFTSKNPVIKLEGLGEDGYFAEVGGADHITSVTGQRNTTTTVQALITKAGISIKEIKDNTGTKYTPDTDGKFTVTFSACLTITVTLATEEPYAALTSSSENSPNDTLLFRFDANRSEFESTFDVVDTPNNPG